MQIDDLAGLPAKQLLEGRVDGQYLAVLYPRKHAGNREPAKQDEKAIVLRSVAAH